MWVVSNAKNMCVLQRHHTSVKIYIYCYNGEREPIVEVTNSRREIAISK